MILHNFFGHLSTVVLHRNMVMKHCFKAGIVRRGLLHDLSKFSPTEFISGVKYYQGVRSPNEREREIYGYSKAWLHHKGRNRHHFEYWTDYSMETRQMIAVPMPDEYLFEMFCDRVAASKIYKKKDYDDSCPLNYFLNGKGTRFIHPNTEERLEFLLTMLAEKGEKAAFEYIKQQRKK